jgi:bifunctional DNase/RNase
MAVGDAPASPPGGSASPKGTGADPPDGGARFSVVEVHDVAVELPSQFPRVTLRETDPPYRSLVIPVGLPEGVALVHAQAGIPTPRPLTHELFAEVLRRLAVDVVAVRLVGRLQGVYLAELVLSGARGRETVPCRASDGLTLALRQRVPAPVLVDARLIESPGDVEPAGPPQFRASS